jgi:hypothetical protein
MHAPIVSTAAAASREKVGNDVDESVRLPGIMVVTDWFDVPSLDLLLLE